jgi:hypothetical protein
MLHAAGGSTAALVLPPAVPEQPEEGASSLFDADLAPVWPARPGVYARGAHAREAGAQQLARVTGGTRCVCACA